MQSVKSFHISPPRGGRAKVRSNFTICKKIATFTPNNRNTCNETTSHRCVRAAGRRRIFVLRKRRRPPLRHPRGPGLGRRQGFYQDGRYPLDSYVYFGADGFGTDELHFADTGQYLDTLNIQWDAYGDDTIYIGYGRADYPRELRRVHIRRGELRAELYIDGEYYGRITLYMQ